MVTFADDPSGFQKQDRFEQIVTLSCRLQESERRLCGLTVSTSTEEVMQQQEWMSCSGPPSVGHPGKLSSCYTICQGACRIHPVMAFQTCPSRLNYASWQMEQAQCERRLCGTVVKDRLWSTLLGSKSWLSHRLAM